MVKEGLTLGESNAKLSSVGLAYEHQRMLGNGGIGSRSGKVVLGNAVIASAVFYPHLSRSLKTKRQIEGVVFAGLVAGDKGHAFAIEKVGKFDPLHGAIKRDLGFWPQGCRTLNDDAIENRAGFDMDGDLSQADGQARPCSPAQ